MLTEDAFGAMVAMRNTERTTILAAFGLAALWMAVWSGAVVLSDAELRLAAVPAITGAAASLLAPYHLRGWQLITVLTVPIAAVASAVVVPWAMAGASLSLLAVGTRRQPGFAGRDPYRHIMWCRRREETAQVMVLHVPAAARTQLDALLPATRVTDSVAVTRRGRGYELFCNETAAT